jgi:hypothetical protein
MSINLTLEINEVEAVVAGLRKLPMELIEETVNKIKIQAISQIQAQQAEAQAAAEPQPKIPAEQTNPTE